MKKYSRFITFGSGLLSFFSFGLPWIDDTSGIYLANSDAGGFIVISFIVCLVVILTSLIGMSRNLVIVSCCIGLFCLFTLFFGGKLDIVIDGVYSHEIQFGAFLTAVGFFLAIAGVLDLSKTKGSSEANDEYGNEESPEGDQK